MAVHHDAALARPHTRLFKVKPLDVGDPAGRMNDEIGVEPEMPSFLIRMDPEAGADRLHRRHGGTGTDIDRQVVGALDQQIHQIGIEAAQQAQPR